ncbi:MAG: choice-of-anchor D domain-containing protein [Terracidiphilus sp.]
MTRPMLYSIVHPSAVCRREEKRPRQALLSGGWGAWAWVMLGVWMIAQLGLGLALPAQKTVATSPSTANPISPSDSKSKAARPARSLPPRVLAARRFLAERGIAAGHRALPRSLALRSRTGAASTLSTRASAQTSGGSSSGASATWTLLGPTAVNTPSFNLVTGRVTSIAVDPSDPTGNHVYVGTTGGGVWSSNNAGASTVANIVFSPLTDAVAALGGAEDASISIGALTVQPGGTGVILAGTGDANDNLDSYYGAGILRSADNGATWSLIWHASDMESGLGTTDFSFAGLGFSGFAWSTVSPQTVVAAVTDSYEGEVVDATLPIENCEGLYYSQDGGATWHLATIEDTSSQIVQSATQPLLGPNGNAATAVVWNPMRQLFVAAVRFHGYYTSPNGVTWTRLADADQPGGMSSTLCPTNPRIPGNEGCPIDRGALAVNPATGDTFAWTVDLFNNDQGIWQDACALSNMTNQCTNAAMTFEQPWNSAALEDPEAPGTIADGTYTLALAAVPSTSSSTGSLVLAGADDLWEATAPYSLGGSWRNATNSATCMSAQVGEYQHALAWNADNSLEIFIGNDSGLWRSTDGIAESGPQCSATDASHFQNLNGSLGSLAEVDSISAAPANPYELVAGLGVNGAAGVDETANTLTPDWPQVITGLAGPVAIDPTNNDNWYVNDWDGVAIDLCVQAAGCTPSAFAENTVVSEADVDNDGEGMPVPATFLVDPVDDTQLLVATCRVWRGPASGGWTSANAISPVLAFLQSSTPASSCDGNALIRSMAAMNLGNGKEIVYVGMYGTNDFEPSGSNLPGHVLSGTYQPNSATGIWAWTWTDLTLSPVTNDLLRLNGYALDISSIAIDAHDPTGNTVYVTVEGMPQITENIRAVYRSMDGGKHWASIASNLPMAPASSLAIDPGSASTVYIATDVGVYYTSAVGSCAGTTSNCWSAFGTGLPAAPAVALGTPSASSPNQVLIAATYGRGIWQAPLWSSQQSITDAVAAPASVAFASSPAIGVASQPVPLALNNIGSLPLTITSIVMGGASPGDFSEVDNCQSAPVAAGSPPCTINITFTPQAANVERTASMTIYANVYGGQLTVDLTGTGTVPSGTATLSAQQLSFNTVEMGSTSAPQWVTLTNTSTTTPIAIGSIAATPPFLAPQAGNSCGASLAPNSSCSVEVEFAPTQSGLAAGTLTFTDAAGTQTVNLGGIGAAAPTDILTPAALTFPATAIGQSASFSFTITNNGDLSLTNLSVTLTNNPGGQFQLSNPCGSEVAAEHPGTCTVTVEFTPSQVGAFTGAVTVSDTTTKLDTQTVSLSAPGVATPVFEVTPASLTFTSQQAGPQALTITNQGLTPMANIDLALSPSSASSAYSVSSTCGTVLNAGTSCTAQVSYTPGSGSGPAAALTISSSTPDVQPVSITIDGLVLSPTQVTFSQVTVGQTSAAQTVTITNGTGSAVASLSVSAASPFALAQNGCTGSLAAGANCTVSVDFEPAASGTASGVFTVNAGGASATVPLSGTGVPSSGNGFSFTVAFQGSSSVTVAAGQTANYALLITPSGGSATFAFSCGTLPTDALCLFSPGTQTLNSGVQGNVQVEISTTAAQTSKLDGQGRGQPGSWRRGEPLILGLLLLPFAIRHRRRMIQFAILGVILVCGVSSCTTSGGGTGTGGCTGDSCGQSGGQGTPTGPHTIAVTVSANGLSQTVDVVLNVD